MGRQAKRRQQRQQPSEPPPLNPQQFVQDLERQGYSRLVIAAAPELPETGSQPQV